MLSHKAAQPPLPISRNLSYDIKTYPPAAINNIYYEFLSVLFYVCVFPAHISVHHVCVVSMGGQRMHQTPQGPMLQAVVSLCVGAGVTSLGEVMLLTAELSLQLLLKKFKSDYCFLEGYSRNIRSGYPHPSPSSFQQVPFIY